VNDLRAEVERLTKVVKWNLQNNDEFGCEFLGITIVRDENRQLRAALKVATEALDIIIGYELRYDGQPLKDMARQALAKIKESE
jgi:tyrosine-protein phosphatase YwqE